MKKKYLMGLVCSFLVIGVVTGCGKNEAKKEIEKIQTTEEQEEIDYEKRFNDFVGTFNTSKFDKTKFTGIIYNNGTEIDIKSNFDSSKENYFTLVSNSESSESKSLLKDSDEWRFTKKENGYYDKYVGTNIENLIDTLGQPSTLCSSSQYTKRAVLLVYDYGTYDIVAEIIDYTELTFDSNTKSLVLSSLIINSKGSSFPINLEYGIKSTYSCTGKALTDDYE